MKLVFFEATSLDKEYLEKKLKGHSILFVEDALNSKNLVLAEDADIISVFIYSKVAKNHLLKLKNLKGILTRSTGFDHIDVKACKKKNIRVLNVPNYGENTVAEHTFALILSLSRKIHQSYEKTTRGNFSLEGLEGFDLKGRTIGIIGLGHIGKHVARIAKGFQMNILVYEPKRNYSLEKKLGFSYAPLQKLLKNSDIITLHCPLNQKTKHLINTKTIALMKPTAFLINTARGGLIKTHSLVKALATKKIAGAALDVLEEESLIKEEMQLLSKDFPKQNLENMLENHLLLTFENVIITPHNAFNSVEALRRILDVTISNINCVTKKKCDNLVW